MTSTPRPTPGTIVRLAADKNLDRQIDYCRVGTEKDGVTAVIERHVTTKSGHVRRIPILEIDKGNVREIPVPALRTPLAAFVTDERTARLVTRATAIVERRRTKNRKRRDRKARATQPVKAAA